MVKSKFKKIKGFLHHNFKKILLTCCALGFVALGIVALWISTFKMPDLQSFEERKVSQSTKIYDRTGKILLYDIHENTRRTQVSYENISRHIKNATVAIEDAEFYQHGGIKFTSIIRAVLANLVSGQYSQGGSTITQQVIKNSLLTTEKTITRKLKEWVLSIKLEKIMTKDQILALYLNETPYGGNIYGVEEASKTFFGKNSSELSLAESAYLAAIPKAPTFYSPYGQNKDKLDIRQKLVLSKMLENKFITEEEYNTATKEKIEFQPQEKYGIRAPHFVEFIKQYLVNKYGDKAVQENGYKVITTLNYDLQAKAEEITKKVALENAKNFNAENAAVVVIDPKTGQILTMVGSRDYFDINIDGNFNVTLAFRQPGSTFKPFVYATAFNKGYTPDTVVFDLPTEFQSTCTPQGKPINPSSEITPETECYMPENYDEKYLGPISLRNALAQSRNIPAIKTLYLAGIKDSIQTAKSMGITSLASPDRYGLTLVLGGGETSLLEMTSAYGTFANSGIKNKYTGILSIEDNSGKVIENYQQKTETALEENTALLISDILSDNIAKIPAYGANSVLFFPGREVASKTGTTNDYKDAWTIGYTPEVVVGAWAGNNNNTPMEKKVAGMIIAPMWRQIMNAALASTTGEGFNKPKETDPTIKPVLRGIWQGNDTYLVDKISGKLASELTPTETIEERAIENVHSILYWVDKKNPLGPAPEDPNNDYQFSLWEYPIQKWLETNKQTIPEKPTEFDDIHTIKNIPEINLISPQENTEYDKDTRITTIISTTSKYPITKVNYYLNDELVGTSDKYPYTTTFIPSSTNSLTTENNFKVVVYDSVYNRSEETIGLKVKLN
ncbi:MAG: PBP1A family penicillin-binding protein [Candidatus Paceibacterota bacterium]|jgi:1A family penicillin-binding protein